VIKKAIGDLCKDSIESNRHVFKDNMTLRLAEEMSRREPPVATVQNTGGSIHTLWYDVYRRSTYTTWTSTTYSTAPSWYNKWEAM
jgi:hypothetical protein